MTEATSSDMKKIKVVLLALSVLMFCVPVDAEEIINHYIKNGIDYFEYTENNGFRWILTWDFEHNIWGAQSQSGTTIIPLDRNYYQVFYFEETDHPDGGYFKVQKWDSKHVGVVDIRGREIIAPEKYKSVVWRAGRYEATRIDTGKKEYIAHTSVKSNNRVPSIQPSNSHVSATSNKDNLTYHYTKSGRGQSQNTGQWTEASPSEECFVQFTEDGISVNGVQQPYVRTSGIWKVYGGSSMGFGGSNTVFYYYVDGNKNMKQVCELASPYGFDTFVYPMSRNGDPTPMGNNGGYVNSNGINNSTGTGSTARPARQFKCAYCNGGRIERNDNAPASFGQTRANKKCNECGKVYDPTVFNHYHVQCSHCGGTGNAK